MIKVGVVDYYLSEFHANGHKQHFERIKRELGIECVVKYARAEEYVSVVDGRNTDEWCRDYGAEKCESIAELCERTDAIIISCPSNPDTHVGYAREVFKYGKPVFIDKTFAETYEEAKEMFDLSARYGTKFFSASSLRFATELPKFQEANNVLTLGGYTNIPEYLVHQIEMVAAALNVKPLEVRLNEFCGRIYARSARCRARHF